MTNERQLDFLREPRCHPLEGLKTRLDRWKSRGVFFGTSSWKYEGWLGQVYTRERYVARGKFSGPKFERECLAEYAGIFPSVCGDFSFYQFYSEDFWRRLFAQVPATFRFGFKAQERITTPVFPNHPRYGSAGGARNENFLDAELLKRDFLSRLLPYRDQVGYIVFQFPQLSRSLLGSNGRFLEQLDRFLARLPDAFRYGVEIRNEELLGDEYLACLRERRIAHVFNSWTRMPPIGKQLEMPGAFTTDLVISRVLLRPGRTYEQAVQMFQPYGAVKDPYPQGYRDVAAIVRTAIRIPNIQIFIAVNNRFVGNSIGAVEAILQELETTVT